MIEMKGVEKAFGGLRLFVGFELEVGAGETVVITGPPGCGKTTLLRMIAGLERPDGGAIRVNGRRVFDAGVQCCCWMNRWRILDHELAGTVLGWLEGATRSRTRVVVTHSPEEGRRWGGEVPQTDGAGIGAAVTD